MGRRDCCLPIVSAVPTQWMLHLWSWLPNANLIEIILTTETKKYRSDTTWQEKKHPVNKQKNKLEKRQCLQKLGESTIKWNTAETSPYPFLQLKLLQIVLKWNKIHFLSTECWLSLFRAEFCYWHFGTYLKRHYARLGHFQKSSPCHWVFYQHWHISTSTADINSSRDQYLCKVFLFVVKGILIFFHYWAEVWSLCYWFTQYSKPFSLRYQIYFNDVLSKGTITCSYQHSVHHFAL